MTTAPRRIGLNLLYVVPRRVGGTEIYARELIRALGAARPDDTFVAFCGSEAVEAFETAGWPGNVEIVGVSLPSAIKPLRIAVELICLPVFARRRRLDLLHSLGTTAPFWSRAARVVTIHDLIYHHFPATFPRAARAGLEFVVPRSARRAQRVLADSQATKDDLIDTYGIDTGKIDVVHLGLGMGTPAHATGESELRKRFGLGEDPIVLSVAAALAHKNIDRLIDAFGLLIAQRPSGAATPRLVVTGGAGRDLERLRSLALKRGVGERVHFTGWIESEDLEGLYRAAACFCYPSLYEGFGMPVLEAMHRGTPVASSSATSLAEVADDAAALFDPTDTGAIAAAIVRLLDDRGYAEDLVSRGRRQAARFTWEACAQATLASYEAAIAAARRS